MAMRVIPVAVTTTGAAGSASGNATSEPLRGELKAIYLDFHASAPATSDTTVSYATVGGTILAVTNSATDAMFAPRMKPVDNANAAITNAHDEFPLADKITVAVAQCDALAPALTAYLFVDCD